MKFRTAAVALTLTVSALTTFAEGDNSKAANDFRQAAKEYALQAEKFYKKASRAKGEEREKFLAGAKMSDQLAEIKLKLADAARQGDWGAATKKLMKEYQKISSARSKALWGDHKNKGKKHK